MENGASDCSVGSVNRLTLVLYLTPKQISSLKILVKVLLYSGIIFSVVA